MAIVVHIVAALALSPNAFTPRGVSPVAIRKPSACRAAGAELSLALPLTEMGAGILAASGALSWLSPKASVPGFNDARWQDDSTAGVTRAVGAWQIGLAYVLLAGRSGATFASGHGLYAAAVSQLAVVPVWEYFEREKGSQIGAICLFGILGKLTLLGKISPMVAAVVYLLTGGLIYLTPVSTAELYQVTKPMSELALSLLSLYGGVIATTGVYLAGLAYGLTQPRALAATLSVNALIALKWGVQAGANSGGAPKAAPLVWAAVSAALSALALK